MVYILTGLWFVAVIAIIAIAVARFFNRGSRYMLANYNKTDIPYIVFYIQDKPLNMLVDTCCAISIISKNALNSLEYEVSKKKVSLQALTADATPTDVVNIPFEINGKKHIGEFTVFEGDDLCNFEVKYGITLHGVIGYDFLSDMGCVFDLKNHTLKV